MITQKTKLSIIPGTETPVIHVNQNDTGEGRLLFDLVIGKEPFSTNTYYYPIIQGTKPNGEHFSHYGSRSGSQVSADLFGDMTDVCGDVRAQVVINERNNDREGSQVFILRVQREAQ
ncbi:MAG: hypothetical protein K6E34_04610 [Lachnospiraceae bacterium]|nr:hypothetical protein [Lachnospiraceae bacterium]